MKTCCYWESWKSWTHANSGPSAVSLCCAAFFLPSVSIKHFFNAMPTTHISQLYDKKILFFSSFGSLHWSIRPTTSDIFSARVHFIISCSGKWGLSGLCYPLDFIDKKKNNIFLLNMDFAKQLEVVNICLLSSFNE